MAYASLVVIEDRFGTLAFILFDNCCKCWKQSVIIKQSSLGRISSPLKSGYRVSQYSFRHANSFSVIIQSPILIHSLCKVAKGFSTTVVMDHSTSSNVLAKVLVVFSSISKSFCLQQVLTYWFSSTMLCIFQMDFSIHFWKWSMTTTACPHQD